MTNTEICGIIRLSKAFNKGYKAMSDCKCGGNCGCKAKVKAITKVVVLEYKELLDKLK